MELRLVVADDEPLVCAGLALILDADDDLHVVEQASDGREAVEAVRQHRPDVVVLDVRMPRMSGVEAATAIRAGIPGMWGDPPKVLLLTSFDSDETIDDGVRCGASGFILKQAPPASLVAAVKAVAAGQGWLDPAVVPRVLDTLAPRQQDRSRTDARAGDKAFTELTAREREILELLAEGMSNRELADELSLSLATVKNHVSHILTKLGLRDRSQATALAHRRGLTGAPARPGACHPRDSGELGGPNGR